MKAPVNAPSTADREHEGHADELGAGMAQTVDRL